MKTRTFLSIMSMIVAIFTVANVSAQQGGFDPSTFDPSQIQKRIMEGYRKQLDVADDKEWGVIEKRIQKVMDARRAASGRGGFGGFGGMAAMAGMRPPNPPPGDERAQRAAAAISAFMPPTDPNEEALRKALDAKAPNSEIKAALARLNESRKEKQAALEKAREDLRAVLTVQQEAFATLGGLL